MLSPTRSVRLSAPLSIQGDESWGRAGFLPPNFVPRNSDLPRLKVASDWLTARSACLICIKQLYGDGNDLLKGTGAHIGDTALLQCRAAYGDNGPSRIHNLTSEMRLCCCSAFLLLIKSHLRPLTAVTPTKTKILWLCRRLGSFI